MESIGKEFGRYTFFNIMSAMGTSAYVLVDTFFIANGVGPMGLTGLNLALVIFAVMTATGVMLGTGGSIRFAIEKARKNYEGGNSAFTVCMIIGVSLGCIVLLAGLLFCRQIAMFLGANSETMSLTVVYLKTVMVFAPMFIANNIIVAFIRNDGEPRLAAIGMIIGNLANIVLDWVFIFPMGMGMFGAALATGISPVLCIAIVSIHFIKKKNTFKFDRRSIKSGTRGMTFGARLKDIMGLGAFSFVNEISSGIVIFVFNKLLLDLGGNIAVAAYGVIANVAIVAIAVFTGITQGSQPLVSRSYGSGSEADVKRVYKLAAETGLIFAALIFTVVAVFNDGIVSAFNSENNAQLAEIASSGIVIFFLGYFMGSVNIITAGSLSAVEQGLRGFAISITRGLVAVVPAAIILARLFGISGVFMAYPAAEAAAFVVSMCVKGPLCGKTKCSK